MPRAINSNILWIRGRPLPNLAILTLLRTTSLFEFGGIAPIQRKRDVTAAYHAAFGSD
jgi:hypothetical protein